MKKTERFVLVIGTNTLNAIRSKSIDSNISMNEVVRRAIYSYLDLDIDGNPITERGKRNHDV